jgi:hypothetical protein
MKRLIELGHTQALLMEKFIKEEWLYKPKIAYKYSVEKIDIQEGYAKYYLCVDGKLDTTFFGCLMYRLGLEMNIK